MRKIIWFVSILLLTLVVIMGARVTFATTTTTNWCHATSSVKNPYEAIQVSGNAGGHVSHEKDFKYAGDLDKNGKPAKNGDAWCENNVPKPVDVCTNIDGVQTEMPKGYGLVDGKCVPVEINPEITDLCPNIEGVQASLPDGFELVNGKCVEIIPVVDVCDNIDGVQSEVPAGYTWEKNVCTKIEIPLNPEPLPVNPDTGLPYQGK